MSGGSTSTQAAPPPPIDYSASMAYQSDNNKAIAMGQIMAQQFAMQQASMDRQMQIAASLELGLENLDTKLQVAKLNFVSMAREEANRHEEKMTEIAADVDAARAEQAAANAPQQMDTTDFLSDGGGSYTPGAIWDSASSYANNNRVDFGKQWDTLQQNDKDAQAGKKDSLDKGIQANRDNAESYLDHTAYQQWLAQSDLPPGAAPTYEEWKNGHS